MGIDYNANILTLYSSDIATDPNFEVPGNFGLPTGFGSRTLTGGTVNAGGSGYSAGQLLTVTGGTSTTAATITVLTVSGGAVTSFQVNNPGVYTAIPSNPVSVTTGSFTFNATWGGLASQRLLTFISLISSYLNEVDDVYELKLLQTILARVMAEMHFGTTAMDQTLVSATVASGGSGYSVGQVLNLVGGKHTVPASITVTTVSGGAITGFTVNQTKNPYRDYANSGVYATVPANPVSLSVGAGTITATWQTIASLKALYSAMYYLSRSPALPSAGNL